MLHNNRRATRAVGATLRFSSCLSASLDLLKQRPATSLIGRLIDPKEIGDIVAAENRGRFVRLSVTGITLYASDKGATFIISGTRFRKDGKLGKLQDTLSLHFESDG